jgi:hypothetical protein
MAFTTQNMNQFTQAPMLGAVDLIPSPNVVSAQILPSSTATAIQQGSAVKLLAGVSGAILVDVQTGPTDAAVFGVIPYNDRKNLYVKGDIITVVTSGYMYMLSSAAISRGAVVSITAATASADPLVTTDATSGHFAVGTAIDQASAAGQLIRVQIQPSKIP